MQFNLNSRVLVLSAALAVSLNSLNSQANAQEYATYGTQAMSCDLAKRTNVVQLVLEGFAPKEMTITCEAAAFSIPILSIFREQTVFRVETGAWTQSLSFGMGEGALALKRGDVLFLAGLSCVSQNDDVTMLLTKNFTGDAWC